MKSFLIKNGHIMDPANGIDEVLDILIENTLIKDVGKNLKAKEAKVINAEGKIVMPGLIDLHVHLREPGFEYKEDIQSGLRAAVKGGFTGVCPMPNTKPVIQTQADVEFVLRKSRSFHLAHYFPVAAVTRAQEGGGLTEFGELKKIGTVALSDDGHPIENSNVMRRAMEYAKKFDLVIMAHCEDKGLLGSGCMNEGEMSTRLGLLGIPVECESSEVARDIQLADMTQSRLHFCHISSKKSLHLIREAKKRGSKITAETAPHYFTLTDHAVKHYNTHAKMNPPLRTAEDVMAVKDALKDGTIDAIATDHAPHAESEKDLEFDLAAFGITGLQTSLPLSYRLVQEKILTMKQLVEKMSLNPARIIKVDRGTLSKGKKADITIFDPNMEWVFTAEENESKSLNSPFLGESFKGKATEVMVDGRLLIEHGRFISP
jgi:dihydroorotase